MDAQEFDAFCGGLPATEMVVQWGGAHVWKVGGKIFALCGPWGDERDDGTPKIAFKASDLSSKLLTEQKGLIPAPYLGRYKWVQMQERDALSDEDLKAYIGEAHRLVAQKLPKKLRLSLGLNAD
ncbi:MAG: MmcQ/YjbR family DNA-binding protein [Ahrensia sp.]|nr:MmcQ/YjbR family DNA-binding protein [Ahrensia sp.]